MRLGYTKRGYVFDLVHKKPFCPSVAGSTMPVGGDWVELCSVRATGALYCEGRAVGAWRWGGGEVEDGGFVCIATTFPCMHGVNWGGGSSLIM